jgi:alkylhydroperoxidase family enzyme
MEYRLKPSIKFVNNCLLQMKKLNALVTFTEKITVNRGHLEASDLEAFYNAGFSPEQVMDVIVGVSLKAMSNYIN